MGIFNEYPRGIQSKTTNIFHDPVPLTEAEITKVRGDLHADIRTISGAIHQHVPMPSSGIMDDGSTGRAHGRLGGVRPGMRAVVGYIGGSSHNPRIIAIYPAAGKSNNRGNISRFLDKVAGMFQFGKHYYDFHASGYSLHYEDKMVSLYNDQNLYIQVDLSKSDEEKIDVKKSDGTSVFRIDLEKGELEIDLLLKVKQDIQVDGDVIVDYQGRQISGIRHGHVTSVGPTQSKIPQGES